MRPSEGPAYTMPEVRLGALSHAWIAAEAAPPLGWKITGRNRDSDAERWVAIAAGPMAPTDVAIGRGDDPVQALQKLADALRERPTPGAM